MRRKLKFKAILIFILLFTSIFIFSVDRNKAKSSLDDFYKTAIKYTKAPNLGDYPNAPDPDDFYKSPTGLKVIDTLESRFTNDFIAFNKEVNASHAKFYVCYITTEAGKALTRCEGKERWFIKDLCQKQHVPYIDFSGDIGKNLPGITFMPVDGHFNKKGAILVANKMSVLIDSNKNYKSDISYPRSSIPALLGDEEPGIDKIVEDKRGLPYKLITNKQGLRMNGSVEFPKKKQHILLMGDSEIYLAGVDNPGTITGLLQKKYPGKTIVNAAKWGYTIDDELAQWKERVKYTEPDIIILQLNGTNITNLYFSQKIKFHRSGKNKNFTPSPLEEKFYDSDFN